MASLKLRDRDGILTREGLIFRVFGYSHPPGAFICDAEYASGDIFKSTDPRAPRTGGNQLFYKFYNDEGMKFVAKNYPQYMVFHEMLRLKLVGVPENAIMAARRPAERLASLLAVEPKDELLRAMHRVLGIVLESSDLTVQNFGVFGSLLHGFYHPRFSDIDFVVYGKAENAKMRQTLEAIYARSNSGLRNEFESEDAMKGKRWLFKNFDVNDFIWHQRRKMIYGLYDDRPRSGRIIKVEFEPVKAWSEIESEYDAQARIIRKGWAKIKARVTADDEASFIPSIYNVQVLDVLGGPKEAAEVVRVFSYMEEFRQQVQRDETIIVEGNLEEVQSPKRSFHQITLTYCPRYYEQVLRALH
ncbi:MAG: nucleotidyltransferase domain-containing protein [Candidatus Bathyarchaeia archaeon]